MMINTANSTLPGLVSRIARLLVARRPDRREAPGGLPPQIILDKFSQYRATALAHRTQNRRLQGKAFQVDSMTLDQYVNDCIIVNKAVLHKWTRGEKGAIFASPHYGPFLGSALLFASEGTSDRPSHVFYDPVESVPENERFDKLFDRFAARLNVLHNQANDLVKAARALRSKQCISIMFDVIQRPSDCLYVPFFGRLYPAMGGVAYLSLLSKAPVIPTYTVPEGKHQLRIIFGEPIYPEKQNSTEKEQNIFSMTCALFNDLERQLSVMPWHWVYWDNVRRAPLFDEASVADDSRLMDEVRHRLRSTPQLLKAAPALESLFDTPQISNSIRD